MKRNKYENPEDDDEELTESADEDATSAENDGDGEKEESQPKHQESSISSDLIRGHINTIILRALYEKDKYGYEIMLDIEQKSHGQYSLKQPTLYSALKRLETQGYIKAYWKTDEISSGGRRKYFTLTDSGKEITEKNLAEWEYSRTIIDSLISDRSFDFTQPAPTPVDFKILKDSVSRVPIVKNVEQPETKPEPQPTSSTAEQTKAESEKTEPRPVQKTDIDEEAARQAEARRKVHENYLRLISEPVREQPKQTTDDIVPGSERVNSDALLYNNKPETERDYKNLIDGIFNKAVTNGTVQTNYGRRAQQRQTASPQTIRIIDRGRADGVTVTSASDYENQADYAVKTTYNKGITLLKCSAIVLAVTAIEFVLCFILLKQLNTTWVYPTVILILGLAQFAVFGILALQGYGKNCVRPTTHNYISTCFILTVISILIISALSFLLNMNPNSAGDVFKMIIIPSITALNITLFAVCFKLFLK